MGVFSLYAGLILPWLGGTFWLIFFDARFAPDNVQNRIRQAGYGFFLGYAVLFLAVQGNDSLTGATFWPGLMVFLGVFAIGGAIVAWLTRNSTGQNFSSNQKNSGSGPRLLTILVAVWIGVHLVFIAVDIFNQPVYPWDAWLAWVYRAKAWYLSGGMSTVASPAEWAAATANNVYTIDAWLYPLFPSVIPYWSALSLGYWSETLINLPVLFAGVAIGMALFGQCREYGLGVTSSLVCCYLLFSIPLFATHIALAGYADIWMAGFCGLGFISILRAVLILKSNSQDAYRVHMAVGLLMLGLGTLVKNEGVVWLLAGLAFLLVSTCRPRVPILLAVAIAVFILFCFAIGTTLFNIPFIGLLGVEDGRLVIPFIGSFALELHNIWQAYWDNFFNMGSWNLLWVLVFAGMLVSVRAQAGSVQRVGLVFISIFLATQLFIFGFTDQGLWADTYTAINRLPLHFVPALLFVAFIIFYSRITEFGNEPGELGQMSPASNPILAAVSAIVLVLVGVLVFLSSSLPDATDESRNYPASEFRFAFGSGYPEADRMNVAEFANGYALLSSGSVSIRAKAHPVLAYDWVPFQPDQEAAFFWRKKGDENNVIRTEITITGSNLLDLSSNEDWSGEIIEFGFLVAGQEDRPVEIGAIGLETDNLATRLRLMWQSWTMFEERSQQSINFLQGGDNQQTIRLPVLVIIWLFLALLILKVWPLKDVSSRILLSHLAMLFLAGWMLLDTRWTANGLQQVRLSREISQGNGLDRDIYQYIQRLITDVLVDKEARILIIGDEDAIDYYLLRAKYHLLPHSINVVGGVSELIAPDSIGYVIFFGQTGGIEKVPGLNRSWQQKLVEIDKGDWGAVYRVDS